jgi:hypothetical protein
MWSMMESGKGCFMEDLVLGLGFIIRVQFEGFSLEFSFRVLFLVLGFGSRVRVPH